MTRFILVNPSHAGNVGAVARAMRVMGFDDLVLVAPRWPNVLQRQDTIARASGALDVLRRTRVVQSFDEALDGLHTLCATAMTPRDFGPPTRAPRECLSALARQPQRVGFVFGSERFGLPNELVWRCHWCLSIPTDAQFGSLNLAAAAQVIAYEWRLALGGFEVQSPVAPHQSADAKALADLLTHWQSALEDIGFLDPAAPKKLMPRLAQLFNRAQPSEQEIHILRGVAKAMQQAARKPQG